MCFRRLLALMAALTVSLVSCVGQAEGILEPEVVKEKIGKGGLYLDVRRSAEFERGHLEGALNIPHDELANRLSELADYRDREILIYCVSGRRSAYALKVLREAGFRKIYNAGGYEDLE